MDKHGFSKLLSGASRYIIAILMAMMVGSLIILAREENPIEVYGALVSGAVGNPVELLQTIRWTIPLILGGLANIIAFRAGIWNIGVEGQLLTGALASAVTGYALQGLPGYIHIPLCLLAGVCMGMIWALVPAISFVFLKLNEIITTLMMNYIALLLTEYLIRYHFHMEYEGEGLPNWVTTPEIANTAKLAQLAPPSQLNTGIFFAIGLAILLSLVYRHFIFGYEADILGANRRFAQYGGIRTNRTFLVLFLASSALAGLTGAIEVLGAQYRFDSMFPKGLGFDGVMVSLLAGNSPLGAIPAGFFVGMLKNGSFVIERVTNINRAAVSVIQALILLFFTAQLWWPSVKKKTDAAWRRETDV